MTRKICTVVADRPTQNGNIYPREVLQGFVDTSNTIGYMLVSSNPHTERLRMTDVIASASDFVLEPDGSVSAEVRLLPSLQVSLDALELSFVCYANKFVPTNSVSLANPYSVRSALLCYWTLTPIQRNRLMPKKCHHLPDTAQALLSQSGMTDGDRRMVTDQHGCKNDPIYVYSFSETAKIYSCKDHHKTAAVKAISLAKSEGSYENGILDIRLSSSESGRSDRLSLSDFYERVKALSEQLGRPIKVHPTRIFRMS